MRDINVDWATVRLQFELYGVSLADLAEQYCISMPMLEYAAEEGGWKRIKVAKAAQQDWHDVEQLQEVGDGLIDDVKQRIRVLQTVKESALSPRYIMLETAILSKAREVIHNIHPDAPLAGQQLKQVSEVLEKLRSQNEALRPTPQDNGSQAGGNSLKIQILGRVNQDGTPELGAQVEIHHRAEEIGLDCSPQEQATIEG